jgi:hypothetical protein
VSDQQPTPEQIEQARQAILNVYKQVTEIMVPIFRSITETLQNAGMIDEQGNLTEQAKELLERQKQGE